MTEERSFQPAVLRSMFMGLLLVYASTGGAAKGPGEAEGTSDRFVLLNGAASFYASPSTSVPVIDNSDRSEARNMPHKTSAFRLLREQGEWLQVETIPSAHSTHELHCSQTESPVPELRHQRMRYWVRRHERFPVLTRRARLRLRYGTSAVIEAGVAVGQDYERGGWKASTSATTGRHPKRGGSIYQDGLHLRLRIDREIGWTYRPSKNKKHGSLAAGPWSQAPKYLKGAAFFDRAVSFDGLVAGRMKHRRKHTLLAYSVKPDIHVNRVVVELRSNCLRAWVTVPSRYITGKRAETSGVFGVLGGTRRPPEDRPYARSGSTIYWRGGARAGTVIGFLQLSSSSGRIKEGAKDGARRCVEVATRSDLVQEKGKWVSKILRKIDLCLDAADVVDPKIAVLPWSKDRRCKVDRDCAFLPSWCPNFCPPCTPTWRQGANVRAVKRFKKKRARSGPCPVAGCKPCSRQSNWLGSKVVCHDRQCAVRR